MSTSTASDSDDVRLKRNVSWEAFEAFLVARGEKPPRVAYLEGTLETMSASTNHEHLRRALTMVLDEYIDGLGDPWTGINRARPDECYTFGSKKKKRPDLAVEVIWTSESVKKLEIYRQFGAPEVWFWKKNRFSIHVLQHDKRYELRDRSVCLPDFDFARATKIMKLPLLSDVKRALRERR